MRVCPLTPTRHVVASHGRSFDSKNCSIQNGCCMATSRSSGLEQHDACIVSIVDTSTRVSEITRCFLVQF